MSEPKIEPRGMIAGFSRFRKKPVVIDAYQVPALADAPDSFMEWAKKVGFTAYSSERDGCLAIITLEGTMTAQPGDWIIKGVKGEFYPCKPDIFAATYEPEHAPSSPAANAEEFYRHYDEKFRKNRKRDMQWRDIAGMMELFAASRQPAQTEQNERKNRGGFLMRRTGKRCKRL